MDHNPMEYLLVHKALHSRDAAEVEIMGQVYPILCHRVNRYRFVEFWDADGVKVVIAQQNVMKASRYADRARRGERITWIMTAGKWRRIDGYTEKQYPQLFTDNL